MFDAVIFDCDGVLIQSEPVYEAIGTAIAERYGKQIPPSLIDEVVGSTSEVVAKLMIETLDLPLSIQGYLDLEHGLFDDYLHAVTEVPGASAFMQKLNQHQIPYAMATNACRSIFLKKSTRFPWLQNIAHQHFGDDADLSAGKPEPDIYLKAAQSLGVTPERCLVFEDSPKGATAALRANMTVIRVNTLDTQDAVFEQTHGLIDDFVELARVDDLIGHWEALLSRRSPIAAG